MALRPVIAKTWSQNILFSAMVELTYRCNLDCFFCYNDLERRGEALSDDDYFSFFADLAEMQVMNLTFTGGEPLSHPSFLALGRRARELGFVVRLKSNGHALRGKLLERVRAEVDPFLVEVSLHGADAETHDRQTRVPGSFERLISNLGEMRAIGLRVKLNGTMTRWNEHQTEEMYALADRLGLLLALSPTVTPRDDGDTSPLSIAPSDEAIRRLYRLLDQRSPEAVDGCVASPAVDKNCGAGAAGIAVDPYGNVFPCIQWRRPVGNLHQASIREIWSGSPALGEIRELNGAARERLDALGPKVAGHAHCMGLAEEKTGDPLALEPEALRHTELLHQVQNGTTTSDRRLPVLT